MVSPVQDNVGKCRKGQQCRNNYTACSGLQRLALHDNGLVGVGIAFNGGASNLVILSSDDSVGMVAE